MVRVNSSQASRNAGPTASPAHGEQGKISIGIHFLEEGTADSSEPADGRPRGAYIFAFMGSESALFL